jgi:hypothetical protein
MKRKILLLTAVAMIGLTAASMAQTVPNYVPTNGLVGWWPFNGNANDESGNGNNGTVNGATLTTDRFGNANKAYSFDGVDDWIETQNSPSLQNLDSITISAWVNVNNWFISNELSYFPILCKSNTTSIQGKYTLILSNNQVSGHLNTIYSGLSYFSPNFQLNQWKQVVMVLTPSLSQFYFDGILISSMASSTYTNSVIQNTPLLIGKEMPGAVEYANGKLDDIGIWNRALTECEIQDLYNAQLGSFSNANLSVNPTSSSIGSNAILSVSSPISSLQWQSNPSNVGWVNLSNNTQYNGVTNDTLVVSNLQLSNHNQPFRVLACGDTSNVASIQIADTCITNVTIYDTLLTTVTDTLIINTTLSLPAPNNQNTILIYPNPASDHITIDNGNYAAMAGYTIKIENNAGQQVFQSAVNQPQFYIDLSTWSGNGLYFVHLIDPQNNTVTVRKIVLQ